MKILIADKFEQQGIDGLKELADEVVCEPGLKDDELTKRVQAFDPAVLIVRSTKLRAEALAAGKNLKLVIRAGSGYDTIDVAAATERGIRVANCPGMNAVAVAELVMGHLIAADRRLGENLSDLRQHKWNKKLYSKARGLKDNVLGIVGVGRIGREVTKRALAFEMEIVYYDVMPDIKPVDDPRCRRVELDDVFRQADYLTLHVPGTGDTKHLVNPVRLRLMKPHAVLVNTSRSSVIDEAALAAALKEGRIRAACVDVYEGEPAADGTEIASPLCDLPNVYGSHHIGASTLQAQLAVADETVRIVREFRQTGTVPNCVNP